MFTPSRAGSSVQHSTRLTEPRRMLKRSRYKTAQEVVQTSGTNGSAYRKKSVISAIFKKYLQCVLAARILIVDFVVYTLAAKTKNHGRFRYVGSDHYLVSLNDWSVCLICFNGQRYIFIGIFHSD
jgi:hypothetical protein